MANPSYLLGQRWGRIKFEYYRSHLVANKFVDSSNLLRASRAMHSKLFQLESHYEPSYDTILRFLNLIGIIIVILSHQIWIYEYFWLYSFLYYACLNGVFQPHGHEGYNYLSNLLLSPINSFYPVPTITALST